MSAPPTGTAHTPGCRHTGPDLCAATGPRVPSQEITTGREK
jgi:hypothetical protein